MGIFPSSCSFRFIRKRWPAMPSAIRIQTLSVPPNRLCSTVNANMALVNHGLIPREMLSERTGGGARSSHRENSGWAQTAVREAGCTYESGCVNKATMRLRSMGMRRTQTQHRPA